VWNRLTRRCAVLSRRSPIFTIRQQDLHALFGLLQLALPLAGQLDPALKFAEFTMPKKNEAPASFETALGELEQIVNRLESGDLPLDKAGRGLIFLWHSEYRLLLFRDGNTGYGNEVTRVRVTSLPYPVLPSRNNKSLYSLCQRKMRPRPALKPPRMQAPVCAALQLLLKAPSGLPTNYCRHEVYH
jgi:hypothetical protein